MAPSSPAKRVTRARAAKTSSLDTKERSKKALAAKSAGVRKAKPMDKAEEIVTIPEEKPTKRSTAKATASTATITVAPRRRVKVTPLVAPVAEEMESAPIEVPAPEKPTRAKKAASKSESTSKIERESKTLPKRSSTQKTNEELKAAPKTRGRPKKVVLEAEEPATEPAKPVRQTRKRAEPEIESSNPTGTTAVRDTAVPKKKVTFQELPEDDKENQPVPTKRGAGKKESTTTTGLRARPVRKPATAATRKRTTVGKAEIQVPRALTPKKITQIARSSTPVDSDEDELNGGKTPIRDLSQSPRRNILSVRSPSPIKKLDFTQKLDTISPMKTSILSPPRRLPQSPFKNSLRESPKRAEGLPVFPTLTATLGVSTTSATNAQMETALQQSPKRGVMDNSIFSQSTAKLQSSTIKPFLSQSPVRRLFSPAKQSLLSASVHKTAEVTETAVSSYFRSSQSPIRSAKVHRMSEEELAMEKIGGIDFDESIMNIRSPIKLSKPVSVFIDGAEKTPVSTMEDGEGATASPATPRGPWSKAEEARFAPTDEEEIECEKAEDDQGIDPAIALAEENLPLTANAASYLLNSYAHRSEEDSSEDELQADETPRRPLFGGRPSLSTRTTRARLSSGLARQSGSNLGFTPLATQLSDWRASSPEKQLDAKDGTPSQVELFSPLAAQHVPGEVQISRQETPVQQKPLGPRQSVGLRKSIAARSSLAYAVSDSPAASSYFADEMAAMDMEQQVEAQASADDVNMISDDRPAEHEQPETEAMQEQADTTSFSENRSGIEIEAENSLDMALSTTGVLEEPIMTDTALLDFVNIAQEAEELSFKPDEPPGSTASSEYGDENTVIVTRQSELPDTSLDTLEVQLSPKAYQPVEEPEAETVEAEVVEDSNDPVVVFNTPVRPDLSQPRFVNTVISKVPLRPEGHISPIKNPKKRSRSLSAGPGSAKKPLLDSGVFSILKSNSGISISPERQARSPANSVAASTPGQVSFAVSDFGDSTLDGIEIPDDSDDEIDDSILSRIASSIKSSKIRSTVATPARTPLKAVGGGVLHGAVVYVDVHTTEGADASGIFVDLLTQMGAKCVREWKWNPRTSLVADDVENMATPARIGITHVVYKDGGKRTLEKVRDAKGEVCCVGVAWVLE